MSVVLDRLYVYYIGSSECLLYCIVCMSIILDRLYVCCIRSSACLLYWIVYMAVILDRLYALIIYTNQLGCCWWTGRRLKLRNPSLNTEEARHIPSWSDKPATSHCWRPRFPTNRPLLSPRQRGTAAIGSTTAGTCILYVRTENSILAIVYQVS